MNDEIALDIKDVSKRFGSTTALERVRLEVRMGELLTLLGPSGSGKTTLLRLIVGFETPSTGTILLGGRDISRLTPADRSAGMVFQQYALFPHMTVEQNIAYGLKLRRWSRERQKERVEELLGLIQLEGFGSRFPRQLSGGQQQRVALARALAYEPEIILMDEPLGALDRALRIDMERVIRRIHRDVGATVIYVTHDQQEALSLSDRIAVMRDGVIVGLGTPEELYYEPRNSFVAGFFAGSNVIPVEVAGYESDGQARITVSGSEFTVPASGDRSESMNLVIRRRSLGVNDRPPSIAIRGLVVEALLLGDDREIVLESPGLPRINALVDARDTGDLRAGDETTLYVSTSETVLVPEAEPSAVASVPESRQRGESHAV